jgi:DNA-binding NarL/FixJ family response regulator
MEKKTIIVLEDQGDERDNLHGALTDRNFHVVSAANIDEAREAVRNLGGRLDVLLLDMLIEGSVTTGAEFGLEVKEQLKEWPPEFLIHSAYDVSRYYQLALQLGAATYLRKTSTSLADIVRHTRVLALRRSLSPWQPQMPGLIERIAERSRSSSEAITQFCREVLCPELEATLGTPFVLLVGQHGATLRLGNDLSLPEVSRAYEWLQRLAHLQSPTDPLVVKSSYVPDDRPEYEGPSAREVFSRLEGAAFIPLGSTGDIRLSLGVLQEERDRPFVENAVALTKVIGAFLQPALVMHLLSLTRKLTEFYTRQRAVLEATSNLCLYVGQEQVNAFRNAVVSRELQGGMPRDLERLLVFGENLRKAGELLTWIGRREEEREENTSPNAIKPASMAKVVREAWNDLLEELPLPPDLLALTGDCWVVGKRDDLQIAVARLLHWLTWRMAETPTGVSPTLSVVCRRLPERKESHVVFEDHSRRLPSNLRERIFSPFETPVLEDPERKGEGGEILGPYLSKVLVELENNGFLDDCSDDLDRDFGHRFVMRFPQPAMVDAFNW